MGTIYRKVTIKLSEVFWNDSLITGTYNHIADPKEGDTVIDVCAAPGGKSLHMAELLKGTGHVEARDLTDYKVNLIEENMDKFRIADSLENVLDIYRRCNKYIDETMPWALAKDETKQERLKTVLSMD